MIYPTGNLLYGLSFMAVIMAVGVIGYLLAGWDLSDSIYMMVISIFTVGYGELENLHAGAIIVVALHRKGGGTELRASREKLL